MGTGRFRSIAYSKGARDRHFGRSCAGHRRLGRNPGFDYQKLGAPHRLVRALPPSIAQSRIRPRCGCRGVRPRKAQMANGRARLAQFPSAFVRGSRRCARARRLPVANSVLVTFFACKPANVVWPVGVKRVAEFRNYHRPAADYFLFGLVNGAFADRNGVESRR